MTSDPRVHAGVGGWARGQNLVNLFQSVFLKNIYQNAFILG